MQMWEAFGSEITTKSGIGEFCHMAFSPDMERFCISTTNGMLVCGDVSEHPKLTKMMIHNSEIPHFVWSKNGEYIVTCSHDQECSVVSARNLRKLATFHTEYKAKFCAINDSNSRIVVADSRGILYLFVKDEDAPVFITATCPSVITGLTYSGDSRYVIATFCDSTCKVYDETFTLISSYSVAPTDTYIELPHFSASAISDSGRTVFVRVSGTTNSDAKIISFDPRDGKPDDQIYEGFVCQEYGGDLYYFKSTKELVTQSEDGKIVCWNVAEHTIKWTMDVGGFVALAMSTDASLMGTIDAETGAVRIYKRC